MKKTNAKKAQKMNKAKAEKIAASIPPAPVVETKPVEATPLAAPKAKRQSHLKLGFELAKQGYTDEQALPLFTTSFNGRGKTDAAWIAKRCAIYMHIGRVHVARLSPAAATK